MAHVVKKRDTYRWTVDHVIEVRAGKQEVMSFDAEFKALPKSKIEDLMKQAQLAARGESALKDDAFIGEVLHELHGIVREDNTPFRKADLDELVEIFPGLLTSLGRAWTESVLGFPRKN